MKALILSGGSTRGSMQVGALKALLEHGFTFDMVVGVSIGSINGVYFAHKPTMEGVEELERIWLKMRREDIIPEGRIKALYRLLRNRKSLFSNEALYRFIVRTVPVKKFGELKIPTYIPAVDIRSGSVYVFGDDPLDPVIDAIMASTALPPYFPPWRYKGMLLVDGGFYSNIPYSIAVERGAKSVVVLHIRGGRSFDDEVYNMYGILSKSIGLLLEAKIREQERMVEKAHLDVLYIPLDPPFNVSMFDFSRTADLIEAGYEQALKAINAYEEEHRSILKRIGGWIKDHVPFIK
ncbi:MAG: patatin-like phospholipase family protein [Thermotogae bacterium]|nr:patatin-like phospholipase family protein [Thermotogota bacterium]